MAKPTNLRRARKRKERKTSERDASARRRREGETRAERTARAKRDALREKALAGAQLPMGGANHVGGETLYYRQDEAGDLVFAEAADAELAARINRALFGSKTWGEFRAEMPPEEYRDRLELYLDNGGDPPSDGDRFECTMVPGVGDGFYPPWLKQEMTGVLPEDLLERFGSWVITMHNGEYYAIDAMHERELADELRSRGHRVERRDDLEFR